MTAEMAARSRPSRCAGRQPGKGQQDGHRRPGRVPVRGNRPHGQVPMVQVDRQHRVRPQLIQAPRGRGRGLPRCVHIPPAPHRVTADVITDRPGGRLGGDLAAPVAEPDRGRQPVAAARPVRQMRRAGRAAVSPASLRRGSSGSSRCPTPCPSPRRRSGTGVLPSHCARHCAWVSPAAARFPRLRSSAFPPRTTGTGPAPIRRCTPASLARSTWSRTVFACRSAPVA